MALAAPQPPSERKRVKVYELRNGDWFDRGTGLCSGHLVHDEARIYVESEELPDRRLLETRIGKEDGYQKQQETLIVWTESTGTDMALSFQEPEGCAAIWKFVEQVKQQLIALGGPDDALSDDALDCFSQPVVLPNPELGNLAEIEGIMRNASATQLGRDSLSKFIVGEEYIPKLTPLVEMAEDLESLPDLHRLCNIMKTMILLNDTAIIEYVVADDIFLGVVGALEYDPDFPSHKANHRHYLVDESRFKEVVRIKDQTVRRKIHHTYRLQYLKDVVLARILDDPTFSVLNSLIFFNQVDIVQHLLGNTPFLKELFDLFEPQERDQQRKKNAVHFIQQCCAIAKNLQAPARSQLYSNFIQFGLHQVINYALRHKEASVRIAGTDILVAMVDHDSAMMRSFIFKRMTENSLPLTDTLIELLLVEVDLGVKGQIADVIKVLLEPAPNNPPEDLGRSFYDHSAKKLYKPLKDLQGRENMRNFSLQEVSLFVHLIEILTFFIRQHVYRSKYLILHEGLMARIGQLLTCPETHLKLTALKFFRTCINLRDEFYDRQLISFNLLEPILDIVHQTMPRNNLLNSVCLEFFEFIRRDDLKPMIMHLGKDLTAKLEQIQYTDLFAQIIRRYEDYQNFASGVVPSRPPSEYEASRARVNGHPIWQSLREMDAQEEAYFNGDDEDEGEPSPKTGGGHSRREILKVAAYRRARSKALTNGASPSPLLSIPTNKPLVDYPDEDDDAEQDEGPEIGPEPPVAEPEPDSEPDTDKPPILARPPPPERVSEKRRREEDEDDELGKLSQNKRRSSSAGSIPLGGAVGGDSTPAASLGKDNDDTKSSPGATLRRKKGFGDVSAAAETKEPQPAKKIAINLTLKSPKTTAAGQDEAEDKKKDD